MTLQNLFKVKSYMTKRFLGYEFLSMINTLYISLNNIKEVIDEIKLKMAIRP
jgi:hypothetical protein